MIPKRPSSFLALFVVSTALTVACGSDRAQRPKDSRHFVTGGAAQERSTGHVYRVYFGTYTEGWSCSAESPCTGKGIYRATFDAKTGALSAPVLAHESVNPSYLALGSRGGKRQLYAVNEVSNYGGKPSGGVSAFQIEANGDLTLINQVPSMGADPAHLSVSKSGRYVLVANYSGGNVSSFKILDDGSLQLAAVVQHAGRGPHPNQEGPHAHFIANDDRGERVFVADLGIDQVLVYALDESTGALTPNVPPFGAVPPGSGPRHVAFEKHGRLVYTNNELAQTVTVFARDEATHALTPIQTVSSLLPADPQQGQSSEIVMSADGEHLYVGNRGPNSIGVFDVNGSSGKLTLKATVSSGGNWPRDFKLDPSGNFIVLGNNRSGDVKVFALDHETGLPSDTGAKVALNQVSNLVFLP
jgi:6-phosphogluconolactonase